MYSCYKRAGIRVAPTVHSTSAPAAAGYVKGPHGARRRRARIPDPSWATRTFHLSDREVRPTRTAIRGRPATPRAILCRPLPAQRGGGPPVRRAADPRPGRVKSP